MRENIKYFNILAEADEYIIRDIPWVGYIKENKQVLFNVEKNKEIKVENGKANIIKVPYKGLKFTSTGNSTISLSNSGDNVPDMKYSLDDGETWTQWDYSSISLSNGEIVLFKGNNPDGFSTSDSKYSKFIMTGSLAANGNIMSLIDNGLCQTLTIPNNYCFYNMFYGCSSLTSAPELPAITLVDHCYQNMFYYCSNLTSAPELPATSLDERCYYSMFDNCSKLSYIKCLATSGIDKNSSTGFWVKNVNSSGTFIKDPNATWPTGANGIPTGWTVQNV